MGDGDNETYINYYEKLPYKVFPLFSRKLRLLPFLISPSTKMWFHKNFDNDKLRYKGGCLLRVKAYYSIILAGLGLQCKDT